MISFYRNLPICFTETFEKTEIQSCAASPLWRNSGGSRRFSVTIGRLVVGSIPGRDLRERNFGGAQNHTKEWCGWDDNASTSTIGAWPNSLNRKPPWYLVSDTMYLLCYKKEKKKKSSFHSTVVHVYDGVTKYLAYTDFSTYALLCWNLVRAATRGKTSKIADLPGFCRIDRGSARQLCGILAYQKLAVAALLVIGKFVVCKELVYASSIGGNMKL